MIDYSIKNKMAKGTAFFPQEPHMFATLTLSPFLPCQLVYLTVSPKNHMHYIPTPFYF